MKRLGVAIAAWLLSAAFCLAQTPPNFGTLMVPNSVGGSSSIVIGPSGTPITGGADTQVLFNSGGFVSSDAGLTKVAGATGAVVSGGPISAPVGAAGTTSFNFGTAGTGLFGSSTAVIISLSGTAALSMTAGAMTVASGTIGLISAANQNWNNDTFLSRSAANTLRIGATANTATGSLALTNITASGTLAATLTTAVGANVVCNAGTASSLLTLQVSATGCAASSARFKDAITAIDREKALADVLRFQPVSYFYKPEFNMGADKHIGFTAEQIGSVDPQWITYESDGVTPHAVKYNEMAPLFAAAIQQLKADNDNLKAEIEELKNLAR